jgi:LAGLIDADG endonuclease
MLSHFKDFKLNTSKNLDNYWLTGFSDADACFQIKIVNRSTRPKPEIRLAFQVDQKTNYLLELIHFGGYIGYRKKQDTYYYSSVNFANAQKVVNYLDKYNLLSSKHLNYLKWR